MPDYRETSELDDIVSRNFAGTMRYGVTAPQVPDFCVGQLGVRVPRGSLRDQRRGDSFRFLLPFLRIARRRASFFKESRRRNRTGSRERSPRIVAFRGKAIKRHVWNARCTSGMCFFVRRYQRQFGRQSVQVSNVVLTQVHTMSLLCITFSILIYFLDSYGHPLFMIGRY